MLHKKSARVKRYGAALRAHIFVMASLASSSGSSMSAKSFAAAQTRRRLSTARSHSLSHTPSSSHDSRAESSARSLPASDLSQSAGATQTSAVALKPHLTGWFSGTGGAAGVSIRVELEFTGTQESSGSPAHVWVWSSATSCFDVPGCDFVLDADKSGNLIFGPALMAGMKHTVVTAIKAKWNPDKDEVFLVITIKLGWAVPSFNITTTCVGVDKAVGSVSKGLKLKRRVRPY